MSIKLMASSATHPFHLHANTTSITCTFWIALDKLLLVAGTVTEDRHLRQTFLSPAPCTLCRSRTLFPFRVTSCQIHFGASMPCGLIGMAASRSPWGWAEEWPDMTVCQIWEINSQPFPPSSDIGCLLPSVLMIIQAVQIGLATEGLWNPYSYFWLLCLDLLLLSTAAIKVEIQHKPVITFCLCGQWREREGENLMSPAWLIPS